MGRFDRAPGGPIPRVGIPDLIACTVPPEWARQPAALAVRKPPYSVLPQVVAVWCQRFGHKVHYTTHYGQADPTRLLPTGRPGPTWLRCWGASAARTPATSARDGTPETRWNARRRSWRSPAARSGSSGPTHRGGPGAGPRRPFHSFQAIAHRAQVAELRRVLRRLEPDRPFRAFHEGKSVPLPEFDHRRFERRLGRFAGLVSRADRLPVLEATAPGLRSR